MRGLLQLLLYCRARGEGENLSGNAMFAYLGVDQMTILDVGY